MSPKVKKLITGIGVFLFWILVWEMIALIISKSVILPSPPEVLKSLLRLLKTKNFYIACGRSVAYIFAGLSAGIIIGVLLAVLSKTIKLFGVVISPAIEVIKATPVASVIIVMLFIFSKNIVPMLASALMVIPIVFMNIRKGIESVPADKMEVAEIYNFTSSKKLKLLYLPSALPYFYAGCRSALGLAWKAGIAAEVICVPKSSIGTMLYSAKIYLESEELFALTAVIIILSVIIEKIIILALGKLCKGGEAVL